MSEVEKQRDQQGRTWIPIDEQTNRDRKWIPIQDLEKNKERIWIPMEVDDGK